MNERIKELEQQALSIVLNGNDPDSDVDKMYIPSEFTKKFAELIVQECIWALWTEECRTSDLASEEYTRGSNKIKEHFGVEL